MLFKKWPGFILRRSGCFKSTAPCVAGITVPKCRPPDNLRPGTITRPPDCRQSHARDPFDNLRFPTPSRQPPGDVISTGTARKNLRGTHQQKNPSCFFHFLYPFRIHFLCNFSPFPLIAPTIGRWRLTIDIISGLPIKLPSTGLNRCPLHILQFFPCTSAEHHVDN